MSNENRDAESLEEWPHAAVVRPRRHQLSVDFSERNAAVLDLARACDDFNVHMADLPIGDYCIDGGVVVDRKTYADFATSLVDGRLFTQAAALARSPHRPVVLLEGPKPRLCLPERSSARESHTPPTGVAAERGVNWVRRSVPAGGARGDERRVAISGRL
jgi:ERCC4-type nuclease